MVTTATEAIQQFKDEAPERGMGDSVRPEVEARSRFFYSKDFELIPVYFCFRSRKRPSPDDFRCPEVYVPPNGQ